VVKVPDVVAKMGPGSVHYDQLEEAGFSETPISTVKSKRHHNPESSVEGLYVYFFTFMLPCIVIYFFLNNQPDALTIPILFCYKTLHVSGIFSAHHQGFSTVHSALVSFMEVLC
jgi:hypothetical protein